MKLKQRILAAAAAIMTATSSLHGISGVSSAETETIKLMPLGDSITFGMADDGGYRKYLDYYLDQKGFTNVDFVGPEGSSSASFSYQGKTVSYDDNHAGYSGYTITDLPGGWFGQLNGILEKMQSGDYVKKYAPDIILLQIGTNDVSNGHLDGSEERLHTLLDYLREKMPADGKIFLTTIPDLGNMGGGSASDTNQNIAKYNTLVKKVADEYSSQNVIFADIHSVINASVDLADGVHPNASGYEKMGKYWAETLEPHLSGKSPSADSSSGENNVVLQGSSGKDTLFHDGFESGAGDWSGRGGATVSVSKSEAAEGSSSLSVTNRSSAWNGAAKSLDSTFQSGQTYSFSASVCAADSTSDTFQLSLQYSDGSTIQYAKIASAEAKNGEWVTLSNPSYQIPEGASELILYVETTDSTMDFYIDEIIAQGKAPVPFVLGDLSQNGGLDVSDFSLMKRGLLSSQKDTSFRKYADLNQDRSVTIADALMLLKFLIGEISEFEKAPSGAVVPGEYEKSYDFPSVSALKASDAVPDPFVFTDGSIVESPEDWYRRQAEISCMYEYYMYGVWRDGSDDETSYQISGNSMTITVKRKSTGKTASFKAVINLPKTVRHEGGAPVILGMHKGISEETATARGYAVITYDADGMFSAPGTAADNNQHTGAFYDLYPYGNNWEEQTGELMAWSWGISRILDALYDGAAAELNINPDNSIVTGVSRYGKAAAVCGAFEKRIKMCAPSCSGAGGLALYRYKSVGKRYDFSSKGGSSNYTYTENEPLGSLQATGEQGWFNNRFREFRAENQLPVDQHMLASMVADPNRYLFIICSCEGEDWVNAPSQWMTYLGAKRVFDYLGLDDHIAINVHRSGHAVIQEDVEYMTDYFDKMVYGIEPKKDLSALQTSPFALPQNTDPFSTTFTKDWIY